jgi:anaerobic selenocysteine-containing dehydrogenase
LGGEWTKWDAYTAYIREKATELYNSNAGSLFSDEFKVSFESLLAERGWRRREFRDFDEFWDQLLLAGGWWDPLPQLETGSGRAPRSSEKFYFNSADLRGRFDGKNSDDLRTALENAGLNTGGRDGYQLASFRDFEQPSEGHFAFDLYLIELTTLRGVGGRLDKMAEMAGYYNNVNWTTWVELNPETARESHLRNNQEVWVESENGRLRLLLKVNPGLVPDVAAIPLGMGKEGTRRFGTNVNSILSPDQDCLTGAPARAETKVKIYA